MMESSLMNASVATPLNAVVSSGSNIMLLMIQNPLWYQSRQTISRLFHTYNSKNYHYLLSIRIQRWKQNFSRLYARRILEIAIASAAATKYKTQLQERMLADPKPSEWTDWKEGRNWMDDTMNEMGTSKLGRLGMALKRIFHLSVLATPIVVMTPLSYLHDGIRQSMWDYALYAIEQAGPTFIKFVQWATTRQDLFSQEFCNHFGQLRDRTKGHEWDETLRILEQELGPNWKSIIQMETTPIGSGCIAQVYKGTLLEHTPIFAKGTTLAVKVQHPGILHKVCVDFYLLAIMADFLEAIPRLNLDYLSIRDTVDQFCNVMVPQLDLRLESHHLNRFGRDFQNDPQVQFPRPIDELTTTKVLTETFCEGKPILSFHSADMETRKELAYLGLKTTLKMIFLHDFVSILSCPSVSI
jgi:aarF domain-containing kinase